MSAPGPAADLAPPLALLAELTHRCPLRCPYCSNPRELERASAELDAATWRRVLDEAAALGYAPQDDSEVYAERLPEPESHPSDGYVGGGFTDAGFGIDEVRDRSS